MNYVTIIDKEPTGNFETLTITNAAAVPLTALQKKAAATAFITVESNTVRFRVDGTSPTTTVGHAVAAGQSIFIANRTQLDNLKMIASGANATVFITYYK